MIPRFFYFVPVSLRPMNATINASDVVDDIANAVRMLSYISGNSSKTCSLARAVITNPDREHDCQDPIAPRQVQWERRPRRVTGVKKSLLLDSLS